MATFAIGDVQGCYYSLQDLIKKIPFDSTKDELWFVGDIVNRGKFSLETLSWCFENRNNIKIVLGNHDLHFLAIFFNQRRHNKKDTLNSLLESREINQLVEWVLTWPLIFISEKEILVHAGIHPCWSFDEADKNSKDTCLLMQSDPEHFFKVMYGNTPDTWSGEMSRDEKMRFSVNALTRMRCLNKDQSLDFKYNGSLNNLPAHLKPWFSFKSIFKRDKRIISGHWSAIELHKHPYGSSIDSACIWGKKLTALCLEDDKTYTVEVNNKDLN